MGRGLRGHACDHPRRAVVPVLAGAPQEASEAMYRRVSTLPWLVVPVAFAILLYSLPGDRL